MNNKKKLIGISLTFIILLLIVKFGYSYLSKDPTNLDNSTYNNSESNDKSVDFEVYKEDGSVVKLSDFKDKKPVVINIWASWCPPCKEELPYFENAINQYGKDVEILMINLTDGQRETQEGALKYISDNKLNFKILFDKKLSAANAFQVQGIPRTIFVNKQGTIVNDRVGEITQSSLNDDIEKLLK